MADDSVKVNLTVNSAQFNAAMLNAIATVEAFRQRIEAATTGVKPSLNTLGDELRRIAAFAKESEAATKKMADTLEATGKDVGKQWGRSIAEAEKLSQIYALQTFEAFRLRAEAIGSIALGLLRRVQAGFNAVIRDASESERATSSLDAALMASGEDVAVWSKRLDDAANKLQRTTEYSDEFAKSLYTLAIGLGVPASRVEELTKKALALSLALRGRLNPERSLRVLSGNGGLEDVQALEQALPKLRGVTDQMQRLAIINQTVAVGFALLDAQGNDPTGTWARLKHQISEVAEGLGNIFLPTLKAVANWLTTFGPAIKEWVTQHSTLIVSIAAVVSGGLLLLVVLPKLVAIYGLAASAVAALSAAFATVGVGMVGVPVLIAAIASPITWLIAAATALIGVLGYLGYQWIQQSIEAANTAAQYRKLNDAIDAIKDADARLRDASTQEDTLAALDAKLEATKTKLAEYKKFVAEGGPPTQFLARYIPDIQKEIVELEFLIAKANQFKADINAAGTFGADIFAGETKTRERTIELQKQLELVGKTGAEAERITAIYEGATAEQAAERAIWADKLQKLKDANQLELDHVAALKSIQREIQIAGGASPEILDFQERIRRGLSYEKATQEAQALRNKQNAEFAKSQKDAGERLRDSVRTEQEITAEKIAQADWLREQGFISNETHKRVMEQIREQASARSNAAAHYGEGVVAMFDRIARASVGRSLGGDLPNQQQIDAARDQLKEVREHTGILRKIEDALREANRIDRTPRYAN